MNPHNYLIRVGPLLTDLWQCNYCKMKGTYKELRAKECAHVYPPCKHCGQTPECALDCAGIAAALGGAGVAVIEARPPDLCARCGLEKECRNALGTGALICFHCLTPEELEAYGQRLFGGPTRGTLQ